MDATERRIGRSRDYQVQKEDYSAKKGCHTFKNLFITTLAGEIICLGEPCEESLHDKTICDQAEVKFLDQSENLWMDLGCLSIEISKVQLCMPEKKPASKQLSHYRKELYGLIASIRVKVEHAIAGKNVTKLSAIKSDYMVGRREIEW